MQPDGIRCGRETDSERTAACSSLPATLGSQADPIEATTAFGRATAVREAGPGRYSAEVDTGWSAPTGPNGGYLAAIVARAAEAHASPAGERQLRSLTVHYLRPAREEVELELAVETVREGRRVSNLRLVGRQDGKEVLMAVAALSVTGLQTAGSWAPGLPDVAPPPRREAERVAPEDYRMDGDSWLAPVEGAPAIVQQVKLAPRRGERPFSGQQPPPGEAPEIAGWLELPEPQAIDAPYLALLSDILWPPSFIPLSAPALAPTVDLTVHIRADLPPGGFPDQAVFGRYRTEAAMAGTIEEDGEMFLPDGTLLAQSRQLALLTPFA